MNAWPAPKNSLNFFYQGHLLILRFCQLFLQASNFSLIYKDIRCVYSVIPIKGTVDKGEGFYGKRN